MDNFAPKKTALIRVLQILQKHTDSDHPLKHEEIVELLASDYNLNIERKAIGRNISLLNEVGYDIVTTKKGSYLDYRLFEDSELRLLIDGILSGKYINERHSKDLIKKLCLLSNKYFKSRLTNIRRMEDWDKTDNNYLFYTMEIVDEAITTLKRVKFKYNKYGADKKLHVSSNMKVTPYQMILHNQRYYLMAYNGHFNQMMYLRLDRITDMEIYDEPATPLRDIQGFENGIDYKRFSAQMPYMFADGIMQVKLRAESWAIDQIIDWFGKNINIKSDGNNYIVTVKTSLLAMEFWAMQYLNAVEVLEPISLREKIKENLNKAIEKYNL